jgi:hypothetical protein
MLLHFKEGHKTLNLRKLNKSDSLLKVVQYHGFLPTHNNITHRAGGALDHIYFNKDIINNSFISTVPLHYSDHFATTCRAVIPPLALHKLMCSKVLDYSGT